jgi:hypothetical protein
MALYSHSHRGGPTLLYGIYHSLDSGDKETWCISLFYWESALLSFRYIQECALSFPFPLAVMSGVASASQGGQRAGDRHLYSIGSPALLHSIQRSLHFIIYKVLLSSSISLAMMDGVWLLRLIPATLKSRQQASAHGAQDGVVDVGRLRGVCTGVYLTRTLIKSRQRQQR